MSAAVVRIGTRRSPLARIQAEAVARFLEGRGVRTRLVPVTTEGDRDRAPLRRIGGAGVFVGALRQALLDGEVDLAVHSLKDLPSEPAPGIALAAVPRRADPRDALVTRDRVPLPELPPGARLGTGSPRRTAQLRLLRPDLKVVDLRGNVDSRLARVADGILDGVVLAAAGLIRLGREAEICQRFEPDQMVPAPGQGALAVESRAAASGGVGEGAAGLDDLDDQASRAATTAERAVLAALQAGCSAPVGAYAEVVGDELRLRALACTVDGSAPIRMSTSGPLDEADAVGRGLAARMLAEGAGALIEERVQ